MRALVLGTALALLSSSTWAQQPAAQDAAQAARLFASSANITAMVAKARSERKPDQANFVQAIVQRAPYTVNLEYRVEGINANAAVHEREAELFYVVEGSGTMVTGGKLREERRTNAENLQGPGIDNGMARKVAKGDFIVVPEGVPHWFSQVDGALVLMSVHLPRAGNTGGTP
jgi:mannose-6-phosphate isomerase-like protein (cupin superfamily)